MARDISDRERFNLWREIHNAEIACVNYKISEDLPFHAELTALAAGSVVLGKMSSTVNMAERTNQNIGEDARHGHNLFINRGLGRITGTQGGREFVLEPGAAVLISSSQPLQMLGAGITTWDHVIFPFGALDAEFRGTEDKAGIAIAPESEALVMLGRYHQLITGTKFETAQLNTHISDTFIDLVGIAAGMKRADSYTDGGGGLRSARLAAVLGYISQHFTDPAISAEVAAMTIGVSPRYVHALLIETGFSFGEHVQERRLQHARVLLAGEASFRIGDIALMCGYSDISHFNRTFRRRFGCTPTAAR
ncbi:helix-turn-helix domain-containing protein [Mesorhizobium sp. NBSH29]|nr:helix-turn-helix domain-containing protein [Mesorhizobium sp. NBSH29]